MPLLQGMDINGNANGERSDVECTVIIVGGGAAGIAAAIGARQAFPQGRIMLIESESCLGGAATHRGVVSYCGLYTCEDRPRQAVGGVWNELKPLLLEVGATQKKAQRHRGVFQVIDPEGLKFCLDTLLERYNIEVLLHALVVGAERSAKGHINAVEIQNRRGRQKISAAAFVDCSGDCDLAFHAGVSTRYGNHGALNLGTMSTRFGGIPATVKPTAQQWSKAITTAKEGDPKLNITKVSSVLLRLPQSHDIVAYYASAACDARDPSSMSAAERSCRKQAQEYLKILRTQPGHENMYLVATGHNFGVRESRHMDAEYQLTRCDIEQATSFPDRIALGAWGMEWHNQADYTSSFGFLAQGTYQIPLRSLRSRDTPNLFAGGRCIDGDQYAGSSVRVMGTALATGQAAGVAAGICAQHNLRSPSSETLAPMVQKILKDAGAFLDVEKLQPADVDSA